MSLGGKENKKGRGKRSSYSGGNKLFQNKEKAVLAVQSHFLTVCVSENSKLRLLFKERGKKRRGERGMGGGSWISTSTSLSVPWSLGLRPRTRAREEGMRSESARCSFIFLWGFFFWSTQMGLSIRPQQNSTILFDFV